MMVDQVILLVANGIQIDFNTDIKHKHGAIIYFHFSQYILTLVITPALRFPTAVLVSLFTDHWSLSFI